MAKTIEVQCKKCLGQKYIGKGKKQPCPKCIDPETKLPTGKFKKAADSGTASP